LVGFVIRWSSVGCTNAFLGILPFSSNFFEVLALSVTTGFKPQNNDKQKIVSKT